MSFFPSGSFTQTWSGRHPSLVPWPSSPPTLWGRQIPAPARHHLDARSFAARRDADGLRLLAAARVAVRALLVGALAPHLLAEQAGVRDLAREQLERADGVVVPRDRVVDEVG